jgi:hypothetical protein
VLFLKKKKKKVEFLKSFNIFLALIFVCFKDVLEVFTSLKSFFINYFYPLYIF